MTKTIKRTFAELKGLLRSTTARTVLDLPHIIWLAFARLTADELRNCPDAAG